MQSHWRSCSSAADRPSVNDNILRMSDVQDSMLPESISDKVLVLINTNKDEKDKGNGLGKNGKRFLGANQDNKDKQDLVYDNDKSHQH